jgi:hypothetical protein
MKKDTHKFTPVSLILMVFYCLMSTKSYCIYVTPSEISFDCNSLEAQHIEAIGEIGLTEVKELFPQAAIKPSPFEFFKSEQKLLRQEQIQEQLNAQELVEVLVTLNYEHSCLIDTGKNHCQKIQHLQEELFEATELTNAVIKRVYANTPAIYLEVDAQMLEYLQECDLVASIEPLLELQTQTQQGVALMEADVYREVYGGAGVSVAIIDSGIDYNHPALGNGSFPNDKVIGGYDFGDNDPDPIAGASHGTNCAGVAGGDVIEGVFYGGVAPDAKLYALKVMQGSSGTTDTGKMITAIDWCISHQYDDPDNPILVISMSLGGSRYTDTCNSASPAFTNSVNSAVAAGITVLSSSGNDGFCDAMGFVVGVYLFAESRRLAVHRHHQHIRLSPLN